MSSKSAGSCLLVVEDDASIQTLVSRVAGRQGFEVVSAYTGEHALATLRASKGGIDWVLADIRLPGLINGWVVGTEFNLTHPLRPVIYMSGVEDDDWRRPNGALFLKKPVDIYDLLSSFQQMSIQAALAGGLGPSRPLSMRL
jgi:two-component system OmpR family response regulator